MKDPQLLNELADHYADRPWVMVTADDAMPAAHAGTIATLAVTIATVAPAPMSGPAEEEWKRETVHRWAHKMQIQQPASIRRYSPTASRVWRPPR
ncbi:MAG: hypothetical protein M3P85_13880 [Actinomycetota bacterium]|nr:hypothetical protein [Actinomycetota bacterium]